MLWWWKRKNIIESPKINHNTGEIKNDSDEKIKTDVFEDMIIEENINERNNNFNEENKDKSNNDNSLEKYKDDIDELFVGNSYLNN